jgi:hypothetical protein
MRILLAIDGSEHSHDAARALQHLAPAEELLVLHVVDVPSQAYREETSKARLPAM